MKFPYVRFLSTSFAVFFAFVYAAQAATYTVTNTNNRGSGSLRDAVAGEFNSIEKKRRRASFAAAFFVLK
jgi:hypothetical protein